MIPEEDKERIESKLKKYPELGLKIKKLRRRIAEEEYSLRPSDYTLIAAGETNRVIREQETWVDERLDRFPLLLQFIREKADIEGGLKLLNKRELYLVKLKYFKPHTLEEIEKGLRFSRPTIYRIRNKALKKLYDYGL